MRVALLLVVLGAMAAALGNQVLGSSPSPASSSSSSSSTAASRSEHRGLRSEHRGALGQAGGAVPDGTTVFDEEIPGVANLDSDLLGALLHGVLVPNSVLVVDGHTTDRRPSQRAP